MLFDDPAKRYPHLTRYLNDRVRRRETTSNQGNSLDVLLAVAGAMFIMGIITTTPILSMLAVVVGLIPIIQGGFKRRPKEVDPLAAQKAEARAVAKSLQDMVARRRLHRDLDEGSLLLLEECARNWERSRSCLQSPAWHAETLPAHYRAVRDQALSAADASMDEVLIHYRSCIPDEVAPRQPMDYVDEALENTVFRGRVVPNQPPPVFGPVYEIAEKLNTLAFETERMASDLANDPAFASPSPSQALDHTLGELRSIRQAEDELRQNLRH